jgi:hypothetical protein
MQANDSNTNLNAFNKLIGKKTIFGDSLWLSNLFTRLNSFFNWLGFLIDKFLKNFLNEKFEGSCHTIEDRLILFENSLIPLNENINDQ